MKVILSRKGFDSKAGGIINPIMPDGTLLSLPIPSDDTETYQGLAYEGIEYSKLLSDLGYSGNETCHLDPDIREGIRKVPVDNWHPAFGQINAAQRYLENSEVEEGDIFLFFGRFRSIELNDGIYRYVKKNPQDFYVGYPMQIIFGYLQIGGIIKNPSEIQQYSWHPHASGDRLQNETNTLYIPTEQLSIDTSLPGSGVFNYSRKRILTKEGCTPAKWYQREFLMPDCIRGNRKNSGKNDELYYAGQWQELVINESEDLIKWVMEVIRE